MMHIVRFPKDSENCLMVVWAPNGEYEARLLAWIDYVTIVRPNGEHLNYHLNADQLLVEPAGPGRCVNVSDY